MDCFLAQFGQQQLGALAETAGMAVGTEQQHLPGIAWIRQSAHATESAGAVVKGVGGYRNRGLLEGNTGATEPGIGKELIHGTGRHSLDLLIAHCKIGPCIALPPSLGTSSPLRNWGG